MIPPTTTGMWSSPSTRSRAITSRTSGTCEPDRIDRPITWASVSAARATISEGVWRMPS
jgi:hypothetical protein